MATFANYLTILELRLNIHQMYSRYNLNRISVKTLFSLALTLSVSPLKKYLKNRGIALCQKTLLFRKKVKK